MRPVELLLYIFFEYRHAYCLHTARDNREPIASERCCWKYSDVHRIRERHADAVSSVAVQY
jgi:hypothetical protein